MGHLVYQNILQLHKVANAIDVKGPILGKICGDYMEKKIIKKTIF